MSEDMNTRLRNRTGRTPEDLRRRLFGEAEPQPEPEPTNSDDTTEETEEQGQP